ncbi:MAG: RraA family protein [Betaproteobacteria bacterium]|nr:RraA family protein [Pseudomonadota bacterium]NBQ77926.1 RraA family protein [Betaproteobacteria bacterium]NBQ94798.1 RraA family protein [Betaproteobacteria bacterium]NBT81131.1 RraA family protein [Betaproteobacteria bacterium]NCV13006.1 RraA family protein [Betaproteobacteria bacterium]
MELPGFCCESRSALVTVKTDFERVATEWVEKARQFPAAILADVAGRRGGLSGRIRALNPAMQLAGPAFTVEVRPGDNLMIHAALMLARPGDVLVVDGKGDLSCALTGGLMAAHAKAAGIAGFVIDGAVRDVAECAQGDFPIFAAGFNPNGPTKAVAGRIGSPISAGGIAIEPGDLVIGDADGVTVIPRHQVASVLAQAQAKVDAESARMAEIARGDLMPDFLNACLRHAGLIASQQDWQALGASE